MTKEKIEHHKFFLDDQKSGKTDNNKLCIIIITIVILVALIAIIVGVVLLLPQSCSKENKKMNTDKTEKWKHIQDLDEYCEPSDEAKRIELQNFLLKCQQLYFEMFPYEELSYNQNADQATKNKIARKFKVYDPSPLTLKKHSDKRRDILKELDSLKADETLLKPKESQIMAEIRVFLEQSMGNIFDIDFYNSDWMFGPNYFCQNRICSLYDDINILTYYFRPETYEDVEFLAQTFASYNRTFQQYIDNMKLGVEAGMVKSQLSCKAGSDAFKDKYIDIITLGKKDGVLNSYVSNNLRSRTFYSLLPESVMKEWEAKHRGGQVINSLLIALIQGFGQSVIKLYEHLTKVHYRHCPPDDIASGVSQLPLDHIYLDGKANLSKPTTKTLPIVNTKLDGRDMYRSFVSSFTTLQNISPEEIYEEGIKQLELFYPSILNISTKYTTESDVNKAVEKMKKLVDADEQWHAHNFPANESDGRAHTRCVDDKSAKKYCPVRYKGMKKWGNYMNRVMSIIHPQLQNVFYFTGGYRSVPNCPIRMQPHYNPSNGAMYFQASDGDCNTPAQFGLPFFLEKYGPRFQEWSVNGHEARPGHHFQYQGAVELFSNPCTGSVDSFFHSKGYFTGFIEGWALYTENPVLSDDVDLYRDNLLQELGMFKWQVWRAVRLVVDTGLHYRQMNRTWALKQFEEYTWDTTDFARKEVTRYMSCPGQATAYMIGRLAILKARRKAEKILNYLFDLKEFHYQILSLGQAPLDYMTKHIDRWIECVQDPTLKYCDYILTPLKNIPDGDKIKKSTSKLNRPTQQTNRHYL